jgi:hypothetical protein
MNTTTIGGPWDGHLHTCFSDADPEQTPEEVCRAAKAAGLSSVAITDHDRMLPEDRQALEQTCGLEVIPACEFSASAEIGGTPVILHIIGLWLPAGDRRVQAVLERNQHQDFEGYCKTVLTKLLRLGIDPSGDGVDASYAMLLAENPRSGHISRRAICELLAKTGYARTVREAADRYVSAFGDRLAYVPTERFYRYAPLEQVMEAANTGLSVLCHLYYYRLDDGRNETLLRTFRDLGGQGLEVEYGRYAPERRAALRRYCRDYGLLPSCGSDRHEADCDFERGDPRLLQDLRERCRELHGGE